VQSQAHLRTRCVRNVCTLCQRIECHAAAIILNMHKDNAEACYLNSVLDSAMWERCGNGVGSSSAPSVGALWARRVRSVRTLC